MELLFREEVHAIVGAACEVYNTLGPGFLEAVYQEALELEFTDRMVPFTAQRPLTITYKGHQLTKTYVPDLICYDGIIVELKAVEQLVPADHAQLLNYMKATRYTVGILINFGDPRRLQWKRMVLSAAARSVGTPRVDDPENLFALIR